MSNNFGLSERDSIVNKKNMTKPTRTDVSELGEFGLIDRIRSIVSSRYRSTVHGIGDDCAVLDNGEDYTLLSVDTMVEGLHFDLMYCPLPVSYTHLTLPTKA